ncbi:4Fe-4S ferredoxin iron-sulfur binding domain-containing protein [Desulfotomaculum nigrificans CO-1-SRB]|uniref:4Fe-4S ferredoxin iron-sulfur binding domain-containing protein n=1 Tax=Desulfotomaculum nigrificans (strain DSM 14880 / VKM B-2319 / CO-1-SRB) TaxID=868595 RepID=F6B4R2_DESCC|nr:4Fe-4S binding protein [Desulfotomaculum nigrificans]AEF94174.1 4Fe-4S ferredoxin iron-sulfur binding domain-containing protein [Desulfotomaculum nigrificans CO-1-SRB]
MLAQNGIPTPEDIAEVLPPAERLAKGPVAIAECFQNIPCDPCYHSCKQGAIKEFTDINQRPQIDFDKCNGCGSCMSRCPGLAIFVVDATFSEQEALVKIPYEFLPIPQVGETVTAINRAGQAVGEARVVKVQNSKVQDRTAVVWLAVAKDLMMEVRHFKTKEVR